MGTGITSILLHNLPYNGVWIYWLSVVIFALNVLLFSLGFIISVLRYALYPEIIKVMITHPVQSMFIGTFPMGLATIINMIVLVCVPAWGEWAKYLAWGLWIFDAVISVMTALSLPFSLYDPQQGYEEKNIDFNQNGAWCRDRTIFYDGRLASPHSELHRSCFLRGDSSRDTPQ